MIVRLYGFNLLIILQTLMPLLHSIILSGGSRVACWWYVDSNQVLQESSWILSILDCYSRPLRPNLLRPLSVCHLWQEMVYCPHLRCTCLCLCRYVYCRKFLRNLADNSWCLFIKPTIIPSESRLHPRWSLCVCLDCVLKWFFDMTFQSRSSLRFCGRHVTLAESLILIHALVFQVQTYVWPPPQPISFSRSRGTSFPSRFTVTLLGTW